MTAKKRFEDFPIEILSLIFEALPDFATLKTLILAGPVFHNTFLGRASRITGAVVRNEVSRELLPEAVAVLEARRVDPIYGEYFVRKFLAQYHTNRQSWINREWTVHEAAEITEVHGIVTAFASDFASEALSRSILTNEDNPNEEPATEVELQRIRRNFYRFELYCHLFQWDPLSIDPRLELLISRDTLAEIYWSNYAPWENEQLSSIHDYLVRRSSIPYSELVIHDVGWSEFDPGLDQWEEFGSQRIVSQGLKFLNTLFRVATSKNWGHLLDIRSQYLRPKSICGPRWFSNARWGIEESDDGGSWARQKSFWKDDDEGPRESWGWAHSPRPFYHDETYDLRARGYCFWGQERIDRWALLSADPSSRTILDKSDFTPSGYSIPFHDTQEFWNTKSSITFRGGRGWWWKDDHSEIEYGISHLLS